MRAWFRQTIDHLNASYWFLPALLTLGALLLSFATYVADLRLGTEWVQDVPWLDVAKPDGARELVSTIAGSMISVAGTVFAITIAAVVYASGNYGPRLLTNFMTDRGNQLSLGVFIATFVYCLLTLRVIRQPDEGGGLGFVPEISLLTCFGLALLSVGVLVYFLHHVPDSIRIDNVVASIGRRVLDQIDRRFPDPDKGEDAPSRGFHQGFAVRAGKPGYIDVIDFQTLANCCEKRGMAVYLAVRPGAFVHAGMALLHAEKPLEADGEDEIRSAFGIGNSRSPGQDIEYSLDELVEIAVRALSPGIDDPFTAITCLHWISAATARLAMRDLGRDPDGEPYGARGIHAVMDDFAHFLEIGFGAIRSSAASSPMASRRFVESLWVAGAEGLAERRAALLRGEAQRLLVQAETKLQGPALDDLRQVLERHRQRAP